MPGGSFAFLRASVRVAADAYYVENRLRAWQAGLLTGSYHYLYPEPAPEEQAMAFYEALVAGQVAIAVSLIHRHLKTV